MAPQAQREQSFADRVLSYDEVADILGLNYFTLRRYVAAGRIHAIRLGPRRVGIRESEVKRFLDDAEAPA